MTKAKWEVDIASQKKCSCGNIPLHTLTIRVPSEHATKVFCDRCLYFIATNPYQDTYPLNLKGTEAFAAVYWGGAHTTASSLCSKCETNPSCYSLQITHSNSVGICGACFSELCNRLHVNIQQNHFIYDIQVSCESPTKVTFIYGIPHQQFQVPIEDILLLEADYTPDRWNYKNFNSASNCIVEGWDHDGISPAERCSICMGTGYGVRPEFNPDIIICDACVERLGTFISYASMANPRVLVHALHTLRKYRHNKEG